PESAVALKSVAAILQAMIGKLAPVVDRETKEILPETSELLRDVAIHLANLKPKLAAEIPNITNEVAKPRVDERLGIYARYMQPFPARVNFDRDFSRGITCDAIAFSKVLDLRERSAVTSPTPETTTELTAMTLMFEYLNYIDDEAYGKTFKMHMDNL